MFGSSLRHALASTPPSAIGTSTDSPVRLSVIVMLSGTAAYSLSIVAGCPEAFYTRVEGISVPRGSGTPARSRSLGWTPSSSAHPTSSPMAARTAPAGADSRPRRGTAKPTERGASPSTRSRLVELVPERGAPGLEQQLVVGELAQLDVFAVGERMAVGHHEDAVLVEERLGGELGIGQRQIDHPQVEALVDHLRHQRRGRGVDDDHAHERVPGGHQPQ